MTDLFTNDLPTMDISVTDDLNEVSCGMYRNRMSQKRLLSLLGFRQISNSPQCVCVDRRGQKESLRQQLVI